MSNPVFKDFSDRRLEARFCGVGGQGVVLGSTILAEAAIFYEGKYATQSPTYGSQVRGGPTKVDIIVDTKEILYPKATNVNYFFALAQSSFNKYFHDISDDCVILLDENVVKNLPESITTNTSYTLFKFPVLEIARQQFKNPLISNMISLGVTQEVTQVVSKDHLLASVEKNVPPKHLKANIEAVELGIQLAKDRNKVGQLV